jgi:cardiolipin synthase
MRWVARYFYPVFINHGVQVYDFKTRFLHSKLSIVDDTFVVGSSNLDHRSFFTNLELDLYLQEDQSKKQMLQYAERVFEQSTMADLNEGDLSLRQRLVRWLVVLFEKRMAS